ncbi:MAG: hypothetical protein HUU55_21800 [Myxococcales bacterium]|nr:hypothetical protein [Myxococcales bacterium]
MFWEDQDPYAALLGTVKSKDARQMGPAKAATFGKYTVARGEGLAHPELEALLDELKTLSDELIEADTSRDEADIELARFRQTHKKLARSIEQEVAETEIAILTAAKGRRDLVRLILSPTSHSTQDRTGFRLDQEIVTTDVETDEELEEVGTGGLG